MYLPLGVLNTTARSVAFVLDHLYLSVDLDLVRLVFNGAQTRLYLFCATKT
jgi:hypothetical protein